jgi:OFA family oxalate/formate antiporter-like MFS transporter
MEAVDKKTGISNFGKSGWGIVIYCAAMFWFYVGMVNDGSNITAPAFANITGIDYPVVLSMGTVAGIVGFLFFILFGQINIKIGSRKTSLICMLTAGVAYAAIGFCTSLLMYAVCLCFVTGSVMSGGYIAGGTLVTKWFPKKKGIVMGYTTMGHNLASAFYVPLIAFLVNTYGLQKGLMVPSLGVMILGVIGWLMIRDTPEERGQYPDNVSKDEFEKHYASEDSKDTTGGWTTKALLSERELWLSAITTGIFQLVTVGVMTQLVVRNMQLGFTEVQAISLMTVLAAIGVIGSWTFGFIDTKYGTKPSMIIFACWYITALSLNLLETSWSIYASVIMIGMAIGGSANFTTSLPAAVFGRFGFEKVNSVVFPIQGIITSLNFLLSGLSIKLLGSLRGVYFVFIIIILINIFLIKMIDEHKFNNDFKLNEKRISA